ncbi:MAG: mechanosensitive ion channel family protein [Methylocystis sp.]
MTALTTADPNVDLGDLKLMIEPLSRAQLDAEAEAWTALLRAKVGEISNAELSVRRKNREIAALKEVKSAAEKSAAAATKAEDKGAGAPQSGDAKVAAAKLAEAKAKLVQSEDEGKAAAVIPAAGDKDALKHVADKAQQAAKKSADQPGAAEKAVAATKDAAVSQEVVQLASQQSPAASAAPAAKKAEALAAKTDEAAAAKTDAKVQLVEYSTKLVSDRTGIIDRLKIVLDEIDLEGGDTKAPRAYITAVSGLKVDASDYASTATRLKSWLESDEGGWRWARNIGLFLAYVIGAFILAKVVRGLLRRSLSRAHQTSQLLRNFLVDMSGRAVEAVGILAGLSALEINLAPILAVIGAAGFVVAFALQGTLSNFASGLLIMVNKPFDVGDSVEVGGDIKGRVESVNIFSTLIVTEDNLRKIVPNNTIWGGVIVNHTTGKTEPAHVAATAAS